MGWLILLVLIVGAVVLYVRFSSKNLEPRRPAPTQPSRPVRASPRPSLAVEEARIRRENEAEAARTMPQIEAESAWLEPEIEAEEARIRAEVMSVAAAVASEEGDSEAVEESPRRLAPGIACRRRTRVAT